MLVAARWVSTQSNLATTKVVVATKDLAIGTRLAPDMVQSVEWPAASPLKEPFADGEKVRDRVLTASVLRGEPIVAGKLAPPGETGGISAVLAEGKRAITVKVNGVERQARVEPRLLLVHFLRESLGLTGTHVGCDTSQ